MIRCIEFTSQTQKLFPFAGNGDPSIPEGDGADETNPALDKSKPTDSAHKSGHTLSDWRDFRANLIYRWKVNFRPNYF